VRLYLEGCLQSIFFLPFVKDNAEKLDLKGFTRNLEDGRVEIFLEGYIDEVNKMIEVCKKGPKHAQIKEMIIKEEKYQGFKQFKIIHI